MRIKTTVLAILFVSNAWAGAAADKAKMNEWMSDSSITDSVSQFKSACGHDLQVTLDAGFLKSEFTTKGTSPAGYCRDAIKSASYLCEDAAYKSEIAKIKTFVCKPGKGNEFKLEVKGSAMNFVIGVDASNIDEKCMAELKNSL